MYSGVRTARPAGAFGLGGLLQGLYHVVHIGEMGLGGGKDVKGFHSFYFLSTRIEA